MISFGARSCACRNKSICSRHSALQQRYRCALIGSALAAPYYYPYGYYGNYGYGNYGRTAA